MAKAARKKEILGHLRRFTAPQGADIGTRVDDIADLSESYSTEQVNRAFDGLVRASKYFPSTAEVAEALRNCGEGGKRDRPVAEVGLEFLEKKGGVYWRWLVQDWLAGIVDWPQTIGAEPDDPRCLAPMDQLETAYSTVKEALHTERELWPYDRLRERADFKVAEKRLEAVARRNSWRIEVREEGRR